MARQGDLVRVHWEDAFAEAGMDRNTNWAKHKFPYHDTAGLLAYQGKSHVFIWTSWEKDSVDVVGIPAGLVTEIVVLKTKRQMLKGE